jgi:hypothetical protein
MDLRKIGGGVCVEWIQLAQDRDRWRAVVNAVMNLRVLAPRSYTAMPGHFSQKADTCGPENDRFNYSLHFILSDKNFVCIFSAITHAACPAHLILLDLVT